MILWKKILKCDSYETIDKSITLFVTLKSVLEETPSIFFISMIHVKKKRIYTIGVSWRNTFHNSIKLNLF